MAQHQKNRGGCNAFHGWSLVLVSFSLALTGCESFIAQNCNSDGVQYYQQSRYQDALREFQEAAYADPSNADAYYNLAAVYHRMGSMEHNRVYFDQAETNYNLCLDHSPNHTDCYRGLAVLLVEEGRSDKAFRLIEGWVARSPNLADAKIELARLEEEFGNRAQAQEHLVEALAVQPNNARALAALGKIREESGEPAQALANYQRSLQSDNQQPQVAARVAALQSRMGTYTPALSTDPSGAQIANRSVTSARY